jgi:hypothetical protein
VFCAGAVLVRLIHQNPTIKNYSETGHLMLRTLQVSFGAQKS